MVSGIFTDIIESLIKNTNLKGSFKDRTEIIEQATREFRKYIAGQVRTLKEGHDILIVYKAYLVNERGETRISRQRARTGANSYHFRKDVKKRDKICQECGATENLQVHHIFEFYDNPELRYDISNGILLCKACHFKKHPNLGRFFK